MSLKEKKNSTASWNARTTSENTKHRANMLESNASFNPIAVVSPTTSAVCDDGIPPLPTNRPQSTFPVVWQWVKTLQIWAMVNDNIAATRAGEPTRDDAPFAKFPILLDFAFTLFVSLSGLVSRARFWTHKLLMGKRSPCFEDESLNTKSKK